MFVSALGAITGLDNRLKLRRVKSACVVLIDGLGVENIIEAAGHMPFLGKQSLNPIRCAFPSTTASSLVSFATGDMPGIHNFVGYQVALRGEPLNLLTGLEPHEAKQLQSRPTVTERAAENGVTTYFVGPAEYENSGFTAATMRGADYVTGKTISDRVAAAISICKTDKNCLVYLYIPELDQAAHRFGVASRNWLERAEELDSEMKILTQAISDQVGLLITADHGIIDVPIERHVYLDELEFDWSNVRSIGGDPRARFLYLSESDKGSTKAELTDMLSPDVSVCDLNDLVTAGWLVEPSAEAQNLYPQLFLIARAPVAIYHRGFAKPQSLKMIGQHGSWSDKETRVPLIKLNGFC